MSEGYMFVDADDLQASAARKGTIIWQPPAVEVLQRSAAAAPELPCDVSVWSGPTGSAARPRPPTRPLIMWLCHCLRWLRR